jgi:ribosomal-protein-alanine N-acetyltransferase
VAIEKTSFGPDAYPDSLFRLYAADPRSWFIVAKRARIVGYIIGRLDRWGAEIVSVAVLPECRGQGIGRALLQAIERRAGRRGASSIRLMVRTDNLAALSFYRRQGFRSVGRIRDYYEDGACAMRMRLSLR